MKFLWQKLIAAAVCNQSHVRPLTTNLSRTACHALRGIEAQGLVQDHACQMGAYLNDVGDVCVQEANTINHGCDGPAKHSLCRVDGAIRLDNDA